MIEKLREQDLHLGYIEPEEVLLKKVNELVDAVNNQKIQLNNHECRLLDLQNQINEHDQEIDDCAATISKMEKVEPTDPYAEQRKWIGTLCRFRHGLGVAPTYGILGNISPKSDFPYYKKDTDTYWKYCEPVKPDDDIIYKGE